MNEKIKITKKQNLRGEDGYRVFSVRVREETVMRLEEIAAATNRFRNELINLLLEFGIDNCEVEE